MPHIATAAQAPDSEPKQHPENDISVELEDGALTISADRRREHEVDDGKYFRFERRFGTFSRTIGLPQGISDGDVNAEYKNGVLEVHVRKPEEKKPRRIQIGSSETAAIEGTSQSTAV